MLEIKSNVSDLIAQNSNVVFIHVKFPRAIIEMQMKISRETNPVKRRVREGLDQ